MSTTITTTGTQCEKLAGQESLKLSQKKISMIDFLGHFSERSTRIATLQNKERVNKMHIKSRKGSKGTESSALYDSRVPKPQEKTTGLLNNYI